MWIMIVTPRIPQGLDGKPVEEEGEIILSPLSSITVSNLFLIIVSHVFLITFSDLFLITFHICL